MLKFTKTTEPDTDLYCDRLNEFGFIYFDKSRAKAINDYNDAIRYTNYRMAERVMRANSSNICRTLDEEIILNYLENFEHCPSNKFDSKKTKKRYTLDMKKVLRPLCEEGYATEFLRPYIEFKSLKSKCSRIEKLCGKLDEVVGVNRYNDELYKLKFNAERQVNLRFNYNDYDLITIPKEYNSAISCPSGYFIGWADFEQSDLRIAYNLLIRDSENAKIMDTSEDKYEGMARIVANYFNETFDAEKFKSERMLYKVNVLSTIYGSVGGSTNADRAFREKFGKFLASCPRYTEYKKRIEDRCKLGLPLQINSYFGHTELAAIDYNQNSTINFALNSPMQTGTSEIVILTVNKILDKFYELGYTPEDIHIYYTRHDEPIFIMKESIIKDTWIFKECSEIIVDNWTPLKMSFGFGYRYQEEDAILNGRIENVYSLNEEKITKYEPDSDIEYSFYPLAKTLKVNLCIMPTPDGRSLICIYNEDKATCSFFTANTLDEESALAAVLRKYIAQSAEIQKEYNGMILFNHVKTGEEFVDGLYIKLLDEYNTGMERAKVLATIHLNKVFKDEEQSLTIANLYNYNSYWIDNVNIIK